MLSLAKCRSGGHSRFGISNGVGIGNGNVIDDFARRGSDRSARRSVREPHGIGDETALGADKSEVERIARE